MDPPSYTSAYTVDDFLSEKLIAVRFSESDAYQSLFKVEDILDLLEDA